MSDLIYERDYAREMLLVAIKDHTDSEVEAGQHLSALIEEALNAGCDRNEIIVELARAGAQLFTRSTPDFSVAQSGLLSAASAAPTG